MSTTPSNDTQSYSIRDLRWPSRFVVILAILPLLLFVATQLGQFFFLCELISNFQLFVFCCLLPFPFLLYWFRRKFWATLLAVPTLWSCVLVVAVYLPASQSPPGPTTIRMMSYNVLAQNPNHASVLKVIESNDPDILVVVEYSRSWVTPLSILKEKYPHVVEAPRWHGFGIAVFSKFPIKNHSIVQLAKTQSDNPAVVAHVLIGDQELRIVGIHVASPINRERLKLRNKQFLEIGGLIAQNDTPTILIGDFNCTVWSPYLQTLMKTTALKDSRQGFGYMASWNANDWPFQIPIDHALVSEQIHVHDRSVGNQSGGSDHFPIFCEVSISPKK